MLDILCPLQPILLLGFDFLHPLGVLFSLCGTLRNAGVVNLGAKFGRRPTLGFQFRQNLLQQFRLLVAHSSIVTMAPRQS